MSLVVLPQRAWTLRRVVVTHQPGQLKFLSISNLSRVRSPRMPIHPRQSLCPLYILRWDWRARVRAVEVDKHVREEEHQEGEAVQH